MSLRRIARLFVDWEWLWLLLILPVILFFTRPAALVLLLIPVLWLLRRMGYGHFVVSTPLDWSLFFLLLMVLVSLYATFDVAFSFTKVAGVLYGVAVYYAAAAAAGRTYRHLWTGITFLLIGGLAVVALSLLGAQWTRKLPLLEAAISRLPPRLLALPGAAAGVNPNEVAGVLLWIAPVALMAAWAAAAAVAGRQRRRGLVLMGVPLLGLVALAMSGMLLLTQSRGGLLGFGVALLFIVLALAGRYRLQLFANFLVLFLVALGFFLTPQGRPLVDTLLAQAGGGDVVNSLAGRREIWTRALYGIQDFPFTGMGMNTFRRVVHILYPLFLVAPDTDIGHAHNHLLQTALDLGLPGLVAYLALWLGAAAMLRETARRVVARSQQALVIGFSASLVGYIVYGIVDAVALGARPGFLFWLLLGLIAGFYRLTVTINTPR